MELNIIKSKIGELRVAEGQVKSLVSELIVAVSNRIHDHNDVDSANLFLLALTPINQKKALAFFKEMAGHKIEEGILTKRQKDYVEQGVKVSPYTNAFDRYASFLESGMNFWQWAVKANPAKEDKPITLAELEKKATKLKEQMTEGLASRVVDKVRAFELLTGGVFSFEDMQEVLTTMAAAEDAVTAAAKASVVAA